MRGLETAMPFLFQDVAHCPGCPLRVTENQLPVGPLGSSWELSHKLPESL